MKNLDLGKEKISKLILAFSIPCIISMVINSVYNIVDQIFIGKGVGTIGNAATNVIFPFVIICSACASLIGNGAAANLSLRLGEGNKKEAKRSIGNAVTFTFIISVVLLLLGQLFLPQLIKVFGCTSDVYSSAITYGRIILLGAPFMICYTSLASIIRADSSPTYSMICLVIGAVINLILDPIFIFGFDMGVAGGAWATIIGQFVSFVIAVLYIPRMKAFRLKKEDFKLNKGLFHTLALGASSFITQMTILALFIVMNNLMTKYGASSKFGSLVPLSVYGVISKINSLYVSLILGISIGAQPILGYNYGAGNYGRVKETLKKVLFVALGIGVLFNLVIVLFPRQITSFFIMKTDANYELFLEFAQVFCRTFLMVCALNAFEMYSSIVIQSLGNVKKATLVSFTRQIILFIPLALILCSSMGIYGALYAGVIADSVCFLVVIFIFGSEYRKITKLERTALETVSSDTSVTCGIANTTCVVAISREYASGGRYVGKLLAEKLRIPFYDRKLIHEVANNSSFSEEYIEKHEEEYTTLGSYEYNNDNQLFLAEEATIKKLAKKSPCVIVGRCADYILRNQKNVIKVFLYTDDVHKVKRAVQYYGVDKRDASTIISKINKKRAKYYEYYTGSDWKNFSSYDLCIHVDSLGVENTVKVIEQFILEKEKLKK